MAIRKTLEQMAAEASGQVAQSIVGEPADKCPYCGAVMFSYKTSRLKTRIVRYVRCRNSNCGRQFISHQAVAVITSEIRKD